MADSIIKTKLINCMFLSGWPATKVNDSGGCAIASKKQNPKLKSLLVWTTAKKCLDRSIECYTWLQPLSCSRHLYHKHMNKGKLMKLIHIDTANNQGCGTGQYFAILILSIFVSAQWVYFITVCRHCLNAHCGCQIDEHVLKWMGYCWMNYNPYQKLTYNFPHTYICSRSYVGYLDSVYWRDIFIPFIW